MHAAQLIETSRNMFLRKCTYELLKRLPNEKLPFKPKFYSL